MDKENVVYIPNGILFEHKEKTFKKIDRSEKYYIKWGYLVSKMKKKSNFLTYADSVAVYVHVNKRLWEWA